jgi:methylmalonyl-CoA mutase
MESEKSREKLFKEFPPVATSEWEEKIREDLKGTHPEKLVWQTPDGIPVRPFYRREDIRELNFINRNAGEYPYVRGYRTKTNDWEITQDIIVNSFHDANQQALSLLGKGVNTPRFILKSKLSELNQLDELLRDIDLQDVPVMFSLPDNEYSLLKLIAELAKKKGIDPAGIKGSVDLDPLGHLFRTGNFWKDSEADMLTVKDAISFGVKHLPAFRILAVTPEIFHNAGASICQELALAMASGTEYLSELTDMGLSPVEIASKLSFRFAVGSEYFPEIAKLRSARMLWAVITDSFAPGQTGTCKMRIDCSTSSWNQSLNGQYNNLLRGTTQAMSAVFGGADSLMVLPFDNASGNRGEFSERLARNIQLIMREEAYFNKVIDPGAGSYYIENLTYKISENAWKLFLDIENAGGIVNAFRKGILQDMIEKSVRDKQEKIENNTEKIVGVNLHPDPAEKLNADLKKPGHEITADSKPIGRPVRESRAVIEFEKKMLNDNRLDEKS